MDMADKTLREHLREAGKARQAKMTEEERKAHGAMMNEAKNKKYPPKKVKTNYQST